MECTRRSNGSLFETRRILSRKIYTVSKSLDNLRAKIAASSNSNWMIGFFPVDLPITQESLYCSISKRDFSVTTLFSESP